MRRSQSNALVVCFLFLTTACTSLKTRTEIATNGGPEVPGSQISPTIIKESEVSSEDVEKNIEMPYKSAFGEIPLDQNEHVEKWLRYFHSNPKGREFMEKCLSRSGRYLPMMKNVLRENGLPEELVYIALIESGFSPRAHSKANAVGYWQFIRGTGKRFGLRIDPLIDERRDPVLSTRAAAEYFKALYGMFNSWHLAMASYNVGEFRVKRVVTKYYTRDLWALLKKRRALPAETRNYVPKFIAATIIAKDPAKYGFADIQYQDPLSYDTVALNSGISLNKLANNLNVDIEELKLLNPKFRTDFVPISRGTETFVRIPVGRATDAMAALSLSVSTQPKISLADHFYYRIRRGDNLSSIAQRHRTTVSRLRRLNDLSNRTILRVGRRIKVPDNGGDGIRLVSEEDTRGPATRDTNDAEFHTVRSGENLSIISQKYGVSIPDLLKLNQLRNASFLRKGQKLRIRAESFPKSTKVGKKRSLALAKFKSKSATRKIQNEVTRGRGKTNRHVAAAEARKFRKHTVRRGETMYHVSKKYGVSLNSLAKANKLRLDTRVLAGQRLLIPD